MKTKLIFSITFLFITILLSNAQVKVASNGNTGIGTDTPLEKLHINGPVRGDQSGAVRFSSGYGYVDVGCKNYYFAHFYTDRAQYYFDKRVLNGEGIFSSYGSLDLRLCTSSNFNTRIFVKNSNGYVGIAMTNPSYTLDVNGYVRATNISVSSDMRLKKNIRAINSATINNLMNLEAKTYNPVKRVYDQEAGLTAGNDTAAIRKAAEPVAEEEPEKTMIGFIAQDVKNYFPELVSEDKEGYLSVDYIGLIPVLVEALKEQQAEIDALEKTVSRLSRIKPANP